MSLEVSNKMLRKIRSLVSSCDELLFAWLEGKDSRIKPSIPSGERPIIERSVKSHSSVENAGTKIQIRDPWD